MSSRQDNKLITPLYGKDCIPESRRLDPLPLTYVQNNCMVLPRESWQGFSYTVEWLAHPRSHWIKCCFLKEALFSAQEAPRARLVLHTLCSKKYFHGRCQQESSKVCLMPGGDPIHECGPSLYPCPTAVTGFHSHCSPVLVY